LQVLLPSFFLDHHMITLNCFDADYFEVPP